MATRREIICLANSAKLGAYCFAGIDEDGAWVRPIGSGEHGAVTAAEQKLSGGGGIPELLDVVSVPLGAGIPIPGQPENWELAKGVWRKIKTLSPADAEELLNNLATTEPLFGTTGKPVQASDVQAGKVTSSLAVVRPTDVLWRYDGPNKLYAEFDHAGSSLSLKVTDPVFIKNFAEDAPGTYTFLDDAELSTYLVVSLPEEWKGAHWKLVAGVIRL